MLDPRSPRNAAPRALVAALCATLWACSSEHDFGDEDAADDEADAQGRDADGADEPDEDHAREPDAAGDASDGGMRDASASDASPGRDDRLQPFEVGRRWSYARVSLDGGADASCTGSLESAITKQVMRDAVPGRRPGAEREPYGERAHGAGEQELLTLGPAGWPARHLAARHG
jgi:hypothetical protein